ncbi:MAG: hypothetical protein KJO69_07160 [Gammaproteobacteria bacterium]|nr:hypothetical protein [Gammaproteobacteria bacterium]
MITTKTDEVEMSISILRVGVEGDVTLEWIIRHVERDIILRQEEFRLYIGDALNLQQVLLSKNNEFCARIRYEEII